MGSHCPGHSSPRQSPALPEESHFQHQPAARGNKGDMSPGAAAPCGAGVPQGPRSRFLRPRAERRPASPLGLARLQLLRPSYQRGLARLLAGRWGEGERT